MSKKIEMKVNMHCEKCRKDVLKSVAKISGVNQVSVDLGKQTVVVVGDVDPVSLVNSVRKTGKNVEIVTLGPPKKPDPPKSEPDSIQIVYNHPVCTDVYYPTPTVVGYPQPCEIGGCVIL
ncbi:hypothetical protein L1987_81048 [Smallanthus sonchifolius]|uniref:Uncharacterized protein n=1 Tax=Smallanthus sonchifolius TaxID=185202 RepID=A0ACB8YPY7_9ASTR|nr:hypothetical protein L1987_81048 [Smallanthus sonchifolius]